MSLKCKGLFVIGAKRTPFCKHGGLLQEVPACHAFAAAAKDAIHSANVDQKNIDCTVVGNVHFLSQCDGGKTARYCGIYSGVPLEKPALGVNNACASGLRAFITSGVDILTGAANISLTGGTEIMSSLPHMVRNVRFGTNLVDNYHFEDYVKMELMDSYCGKSFQKMAEDLARKHSVTREEADEFTTKSYAKWKAAQEANLFDDEITHMNVTLKRKDYSVEKDDIVNICAYELPRLPALVEGGDVITSGNSAAPADGASALILANEDALKQQNLKPLARVAGWSCVGVDPQEYGMGAVTAVQRLLDEQGLRVEDVDLFEINETFAAQTLLTLRQLHIDPDKVNVSGGALALGHPAAATGARMITHLVHQLRRRNAKRAIATTAAGGGQGVAVLLENVI